MPTVTGHVNKPAMNDASKNFSGLLTQRAAEVEAVLDRLLSPDCAGEEITRPPKLLAAMRHGVLNGGKRIRPFLVIEAARIFDADMAAALATGAALELIHCYSLIHDDLPAMDDDDLRRGKPTVHIAFDEATAILAGDSLLTLAFDVLTRPQSGLDDGRKAALVLGLAQAAGIGGMAGGQILDLDAENSAPDEAGIIRLQSMKTGALLRYACEAGAIVGNAAERERDRLKRFGEMIGLAFQLADDLLDVTSDASQMGKATGKDAARGKGTLVSLHGVDWARNRLDGLVGEACALLEPFGDRADVLRQTASFIAIRES